MRDLNPYSDLSFRDQERSYQSWLIRQIHRCVVHDSIAVQVVPDQVEETIRILEILFSDAVRNPPLAKFTTESPLSSRWDRRSDHDP